MDHEAYKHLKEDFVSNYNGTTVLEIALNVSSAPISVLLRNVLCSWLIGTVVMSYGRYKFLLDYVTLILPVLGCFTLLANSLHTVFTVMVLTSAGLLLCGDKINATLRKRQSSKLSWNILSNAVMSGKRPFITHFRAYVNIATAIAILAVDFVIFPRRFCKAETYGTGMMDVGVGAYVISNAIVSPEARGKQSHFRGLSNYLSAIWKSVLSTFPLLVLGFVRVVSVKAADYQEHVSEYGVHWNFFFTLAVVKVFSTIVLGVFSHKISWLLALCVAGGYQFCLTGLGWRDFVLGGWDRMGSRNDLLEANREGFFSCFGYLAIYFAGITLGKYLLRPRARLKDWVKAFLTLVLLDAFFWTILYLSNIYVEPVSRRMANLGYIIWMMCYNLQLLACFLLVDILCILFQEMGLLLTSTHSRKQPKGDICLLEAINRNGLAFFLLANLLTGAVNFSMATILAPPVTGLTVVILYTLVLCYISFILHVRNITLKCW